MDGLIMAGQLILGLSILIVLHELGHFLAARAFGIKVEKFYLFFDAWGVKLFKFNYKGCEYGIGWLPLGGYVKIAGMIDESMDTEQMAGPPQPHEFRSKPAWQRLIVMLGGVFVNIVLGIFIFWMMTFKYGETFISNDKLVQGIVPGSIGKDIGLVAGDRITAVDGEKVVRFNELLSSKVLMGGVDLTVERNGTTEHIAVPNDVLNDVADFGMDEFVRERVYLNGIADVQKGGAADQAGFLAGDSILALAGTPLTFFDEFQAKLAENKNKEVDALVFRNGQEINLQIKVPEDGVLGVSIPFNLPVETVQYSFLQSLPIGASRAWGSLVDNAKGLGKVATGQVKATKALSGPVGIAEMFGAEVNWVRFWTLVGLLSMALALMNLLPIPGLDGGHTMFLLIEMVQGKPMSDKFMETAQLVGFVIIVALMVFVMGNDILKLIQK
ncbi:RIP metalloprotease RseP [Albibacterium sp.]|uniref:RIP metalloprotease RseP n=1 Tax=Albibacterium sp. TaxID=2952885 RepID=UPI002B688959|nr:RIP metalloprotease RseP [Albibacterium sp.]HUH19679.1 RIP metalloprotease RseP [Albibacterium sp.]